MVNTKTSSDGVCMRMPENLQRVPGGASFTGRAVGKRARHATAVALEVVKK